MARVRYMLFKKPEKYSFTFLCLWLCLIFSDMYPKNLSLLIMQGMAEAGGRGGKRHPPPPDFGRLVNPISTRGSRLCPPHFYFYTPDFQTFRHPCHVHMCAKIIPSLKSTCGFISYCIAKFLSIWRWRNMYVRITAVHQLAIFRVCK